MLCFLFFLHQALLPISISTLHTHKKEVSLRVDFMHEMVRNISYPSSNSNVDDDYIDMEVSSLSNFLCYSINKSPSQSREFEFQMSSFSHEGETTTSPADELFYKGKLLPLHLPPRLQMVQKLLQNPTSTTFTNRRDEILEDSYAIPFISSSRTTPSTNTNTPLESCNVSPSESCRISNELNPDEYFFEWSTEFNCSTGDYPNKKYSWIKKLKQKQCLLGQKLKASRSYLKSWFGKSACTTEIFAKAESEAEAEAVSRSNKDCVNKYMKVGKKNPFVKINNERCQTSITLKKSIERDMAEDVFSCQRRSFSGAIQWHSSSSSSTSSSCSSSFSFSSSNGFYDLQFLKRSSTANSEIESSIEGAIAHCKRSQQPRTTASEVGVCSLSASVVAAPCGNQ